MSVINPVASGLRRELAYVPKGPWLWHWRGRRFETLFPIRGHIAEFFAPNLDDFGRQYPQRRKQLERHDELLSQLADQVEAAFDRLMGASGEEFRKRAKVALTNVGKGDEGFSVEYLASYVAGNVTELSSRYDLADVYNSDSGLRRLGFESVEKERGRALEVAAEFARANEQIVEALEDLRHELANRYGARIVPVDSNLGL